MRRWCAKTSRQVGRDIGQEWSSPGPTQEFFSAQQRASACQTEPRSKALGIETAASIGSALLQQVLENARCRRAAVQHVLCSGCCRRTKAAKLCRASFSRRVRGGRSSWARTIAAAVLATPSPDYQCFILLAQHQQLVLRSLEFPLAAAAIVLDRGAKAPFPRPLTHSPTAAKRGQTAPELLRGCVRPGDTDGRALGGSLTTAGCHQAIELQQLGRLLDRRSEVIQARSHSHDSPEIGRNPAQARPTQVAEVRDNQQASGLDGSARSCFLIQGDGEHVPLSRATSHRTQNLDPAYGFIGQVLGPVQGQPLHGLALLVDLMSR